MTKEISLNSSTRSDEIKNLNEIRDKGNIPAVMYGGTDVKNKNIELKLLDFERAYNDAGESTLIDLKIDDKESVKVIIKDVQKNPITDKVIHADFYQVDMKQKITTEIPLEFIGVSKAVNELGGFLITNFDHVEVECLPGDLVNSISVDISSLDTFHDSIKRSEVVLPEGMMPIGDENDQIVTVSEPRKEEEILTEATEETTEEGDAKEGEEKKEEAKGGEEKKEEAPETKK